MTFSKILETSVVLHQFDFRLSCLTFLCASESRVLFSAHSNEKSCFVSPGSWLFFSRWSSCGVSEVSSLPSAPLPSCVPNVGSVSWRESVCQVDYFHLINPCPFCLSVFPSEWFTHSVNHPLATFLLLIHSFKLSPRETGSLFDAHKVPLRVWTHVKFMT